MNKIDVVLVVHFTDAAPLVKGFEIQRLAEEYVEAEIRTKYGLSKKDLVVPGVGPTYLYYHNPDDPEIAVQAYIVDGSTFFGVDRRKQHWIEY